jgi:MscS family membrane protein
MKKNLAVLLPVMMMLAGVPVCAQEETDEATGGPQIAADDFGRGTPLRTAEGFLAAVDALDYETAAEYLDLRNLRGQASELTGVQLARRLGVIVNRADWVDIDDLVDDPAGRSNDNLPSYRDSIGVVLDDGKENRLLLQRVPRGDGVSIWKVSNATVSIIPRLYATYGYPEFIEKLRRKLPEATFLGYELFKWVILLAVGILIYATLFLIALVVRRLFGVSGSPSNQRIYDFLVLPFGIWSVLISLNSVASALGAGDTAETFHHFSPIPIIVTVWMLSAATNLLRDLYTNRLRQQGRTGAAVLLKPASNAVKLLIAVSGVLVYLDTIGINIATVLAGLGVGGIAVALALQKPMEDVFGAITLYTQQPVRVGDFCRIGSVTGTVEEIGLRTTSVRTLDNTLIAIPNAQLASEPIDNISARHKILYRPILRLRYDTTPEQILQIVDNISELLGSHKRILQDGHRVRFKEIADDALLVEVYAYVDTNQWSVYLELAQELNLRILEILAQAGTTLSPPARTLHIEQSDSVSKPTIG